MNATHLYERINALVVEVRALKAENARLRRQHDDLLHLILVTRPAPVIQVTLPNPYDVFVGGDHQG